MHIVHTRSSAEIGQRAVGAFGENGSVPMRRSVFAGFVYGSAASLVHIMYAEQKGVKKLCKGSLKWLFTLLMILKFHYLHPGPPLLTYRQYFAL